MPYKYIGRRTDFKGKTLWEILGNLKNFGVGRVVARNMFQRYPESSYMKIMKVEALPNVKPSYDDKRKVIALVERTFRGVQQEKLVQLESATYKADYFLVPKHKESEFCQKTNNDQKKILPRTMEYPPILKELLQQKDMNGKTNVGELKMNIAYNKTIQNRYRVAKVGEIPTEPEPSIGLGNPISPSLYENIK